MSPTFRHCCDQVDKSRPGWSGQAIGSALGDAQGVAERIGEAEHRWDAVGLGNQFAGIDAGRPQRGVVSRGTLLAGPKRAPSSCG